MTSSYYSNYLFSSTRCILILLLLSSLLITGCLFKKTKDSDVAASSEAGLYNSAQTKMKHNDYEGAIQFLETMERRYPFGEYSKSAQLLLIYAHYGADEPESAIAAANRFIRLHPKHSNVDYAYYMKGLIAFPDAATILQRFFNVDLSQRDIDESKLSFAHFLNLTKRFPESEYTPDALKRMEFLRNIIARHEIHIANYYLERKAYLAATNRGRYVVENFQRTPAVPDALAVMAQGYHEMNMHDLANSSINTLRTNYPNHPALNKDGEFNFSYSTKKSNSWLDIATLGLLSSTKPPGFNSEEIYNPSPK